MKNPVRLAAAIAVLVASLDAETVRKEVRYEFEGTEFVATAIWDDAGPADRPGILMVPNWMGPTENAFIKAAEIAGEDRVVFVADMYGADVRPADGDEAAAAAGKVRADRPMMRRRVNRALEVFRGMAAKDPENGAPIDGERFAAIGFCFGGGCVLELARSGTDVAAVVSFHGNLDTPGETEPGIVRSPILVCHGAADPFVPQEQVAAFVAEMQAAEVADWQLVQLGGAVHSFTNPDADREGEASYDARTARRAFALMDLFLGERFAAEEK